MKNLKMELWDLKEVLLKPNFPNVHKAHTKLPKLEEHWEKEGLHSNKFLLMLLETLGLPFEDRLQLKYWISKLMRMFKTLLPEYKSKYCRMSCPFHYFLTVADNLKVVWLLMKSSKYWEKDFLCWLQSTYAIARCGGRLKICCV